MNDEKYMKLALELAEKGRGWVTPNPMVGAVIVKDNEIIGTGYHKKQGDPHAERNAIASCTTSAKGATMYVTLEPCCHWGKTPPCTDAIIENGISTVVIGSKDPNPLVSGNGIHILQEHGVIIRTGVLEKECALLNQVFFHYIQTKTPFLAMKYAMTLDGKIATYTGKSKWITGEEARAHTHFLRHMYTAIMVGINTVIKDDPLLTCRLPSGKNPTRIICDTNLRMPLSSQIVQTAKENRTYIATAADDSPKAQQLLEHGCFLIKTPKKDNHLDLNALMIELGKEKIDSILLEGGSVLNYSALCSGVVNKVYAYVAPKIFGGEQAKTPVGGIGMDSPNEAFQFTNRKVTAFGEDVLLEFDLKRGV